MCGIVGYIGEKQATPILMEGLSKLEYRGYDSAGVAVSGGNGIEVVKTKGRLAALSDKLKIYPVTGRLGIGHTRWATHGAPSDLNSHPHTSEAGSIAVVHNGIIENYMHLKEELTALGYTFITETDTETAAHLIDHYYRSGMDMLAAVRAAVDRIDGSYALGVLCRDFPDTLFAARKDSPLIIGVGKGEGFIASDMPAILSHTRDVYLLEDFEVARITADDIAIFGRDGKRVSRSIFHVDWDIESAEKGGFDHFMLKEIFEQARVVRDTVLPRLGRDSIRLEDIKLSAAELSGIDKIYIVACGTAYHAGLVGKYMIEHLCRMPVIAELASEFRYNDPIVDERTLLIIISQSGETADTLAAMRLARQRGARVIAIVNVVGSSIAREAGDVLYTVAGPEIAVASTKAFSAQVAAVSMLAVHLAREMGRLDNSGFDALRAELAALPDHVAATLDRAGQVEAFTKKYLRAKNVFYIGRGLDYLVSMEGSLKLKEIAYVHSEPYAAGELKHGPIALIECSTLIIGLVTQEHLLDKTISNIRECRARGAMVLAIAMEGNAKVSEFADDVFFIPRCSHMMAPLLANIPQQLFAYYMGLGLGNDVDKPRNLAKSVTVE